MKTNIVVCLKNCVTYKKVSLIAVLLGVVFISAYHWGFFTNLLAQEIKGKEPIAIASTTTIPKSLLKWEKPDLTIILTAQQHGYLLPCGCSRPQVGGLERRYNFIQALKTNGWNLTALDLGDLPQKQGPVSLPNEQGLIKYRYAMNAQKKLAIQLLVLENMKQPCLCLTPLLSSHLMNLPHELLQRIF